MGSGSSKKEEVKPNQANLSQALKADEGVTEEQKQQHKVLVERIEKQQMEMLKAAEAAKAMNLKQREQEESQKRAEEEAQRMSLLRQPAKDELQIRTQNSGPY